jgi:hypothetical protein
VKVTAVEVVAIKAPESVGFGKKLAATELTEMGGASAAKTVGVADRRVATETRAMSRGAMFLMGKPGISHTSTPPLGRGSRE